MKPSSRFWDEEFGIDRTLETLSTFSSLANKHVVAALINRFPKLATRIFARSRGELARLLFVEREGGSFRVLRAMYRHGDGMERGDMINRLLLQSPAVKAARNRRRIAQEMLHRSICAMSNRRPVLVMAVGGGDGRLEAEAIARVGRQDVFYCGVDRDSRAVTENNAVLSEFGLQGRGCTLRGTISSTSDVESALKRAGRQFGIQFERLSICVCQGIAEYLDLHSTRNDELSGMLQALHDMSISGGRLVISHTDHHDRVRYLEEGLAWFMRLRGREELASVVRRAGWEIDTCEREPMGLISMCMASRTANLRGSSPIRSGRI